MYIEEHYLYADTTTNLDISEGSKIVGAGIHIMDTYPDVMPRPQPDFRICLWVILGPGADINREFIVVRSSNSYVDHARYIATVQEPNAGTTWHILDATICEPEPERPEFTGRQREMRV